MGIDGIRRDAKVASSSAGNKMLKVVLGESSATFIPRKNILSFAAYRRRSHPIDDLVIDTTQFGFVQVCKMINLALEPSFIASASHKTSEQIQTLLMESSQ